MFESLSDKLSGILNALTRRGALSEEDVNLALREVRRALIEADVALDVVRSFTDKVRERAVGQEVVRSVSPGQMVIKIVNDVLVDTLGSEASPIDLEAVPPVAILMVGLQGSGKTTSTGKIARRLTDRMKRKVLMASLDTRRPAAMEQLASLGKQLSIEVLPIVTGQSAVQIAKRAMDAARLGGFDVVMLDTAGRTTVDDELMAEVAEVKASTKPHEVLLVADALTGQDAVNTAKAFDERVGITGIVLTRVDGDGRGGAALSMRAITGKPIKLVGTGEKMDALEDFHPARIANRILGMGDVVSLVEKAVENIDQEKAMRTAERMRKGQFDLTDMRDQLAQIEKIGGVGGLMGMIPGIAKMKNQIAASHLDSKVVKQQIAIVNSMTAAERKNPDILKASRKKRIAAGAGVSVELVNRLLKQHRQMADMMKMMGQNKRGGPMAGLANMFGLGGGGMPSPEEIAAMQKQMGGGAALPEFPGTAKPPAGLPPLPGGAPKLPGLPGLGVKPTLPGLGSFKPFGGKKK